MFRIVLMTLFALASISCTRDSAESGDPTQGPVGASAWKAVPRQVVDAHGRVVEIADVSRVVAAGGGVTEILFALGAADRVVGVDTSSVYPEAAMRLPKVGYQRRLSAEGVLALAPTLVVATTEAGPPPALRQIAGAGVPVLQVTAEHTIDGARQRIATLAHALGLEPAGEFMVERLDEELVSAIQALSTDAPKVMFIYARGQGTVNVAGRNTAADEMIRLAGASNAITAYEGYKPLTSEAAVAAAPDVILLPTRGIQSLGGTAAVLELPGLALTPAGRAHRVVQMDDLLLLGFGPRTGQAVAVLRALLLADRAEGAAAGGLVARGEGSRDPSPFRRGIGPTKGEQP